MGRSYEAYGKDNLTVGETSTSGTTDVGSKLGSLRKRARIFSSEEEVWAEQSHEKAEQYTTVLIAWHEAINTANKIRNHKLYNYVPRTQQDSYQKGLDEMAKLWHGYSEGSQKISDLSNSIGRFKDLNNEMSNPELIVEELMVEEQRIIENASLSQKDKYEELKSLVPKANELSEKANECLREYEQSTTMAEQANNEQPTIFHLRKEDLLYIKQVADQRSAFYRDDKDKLFLQIYKTEREVKKCLKRFKSLKEKLLKLGDKLHSLELDTYKEFTIDSRTIYRSKKEIEVKYSCSYLRPLKQSYIAEKDFERIKIYEDEVKEYIDKMQIMREILEKWENAVHTSDIIIQNKYYHQLPQAERDIYKRGLDEVFNLHKSFREGYKEINDLREALGRFSDLNSQMSKDPEMRFRLLKGKFNQLKVEEQEIMENPSLSQEDKYEELKRLVPKAEELGKQANEWLISHDQRAIIVEQGNRQSEDLAKNEQLKSFYSQKQGLLYIKQVADQRLVLYGGKNNSNCFIAIYKIEREVKSYLKRFKSLKEKLTKLSDGSPSLPTCREFIIEAKRLERLEKKVKNASVYARDSSIIEKYSHKVQNNRQNYGPVIKPHIQ